MDSLGDRMKSYEAVYSQVLPERTPVIVRIDGKAFHTVTRGLNKPWDYRIATAMKATALSLLSGMQNAVVGYTQSDEISILMANYINPETQSWFGNKVQKIASVAASIATLTFNKTIDEEIRDRDYLFDARVFAVPLEDVKRYFIWRHMDARRNSISSLARCYFSHKELQGKKTSEMLSMMRECGVDWHSVHSHYRYGVLITKNMEEGTFNLHGQTPDLVKTDIFDQYTQLPVLTGVNSSST